MQAVGADQEVVAGGAAVGGAHGDGTAVVRYSGDGLAEADPCAGLLGALEEDGGEVGAVHAQGGGEVVAAGPDVLEDGDDGAGGVRGAQAEGAERVALRLDLLPDAELAEDAQGVALQGDAGAEGLRGSAFSRTSTSTPASASRMAAASPAAPAPTIATFCTAAIADSFVLTA